MCITAASQELTAIHIDHKGIASALVSQALPRESPIQGHRSGDESSGKLYEASGPWRNTAQGLGKYGRGMDLCAKVGRPEHGSMSQKEWIEM